MVDMEKRRKQNKVILLVILGMIVLGATGMIVFSIATAPSDQEIAEWRRKDSIRTAQVSDSLRAIREEHERRMKTDRKYRDSVNAEEKRAAKEAEEYSRRNNPQAHVDVSARWTKGGFGTVALATVTIKNGSLKTMRDAKVRFQFKTESGTVLRTEDVVVGKIWKPGQTKSSGELNLGFISQQTAGMTSELIDAVWSDDDVR